MTRSTVALDDVTVNNLGTFKIINEVCLPTTYPDSWYENSVKLPSEVSQLAFYSELPVGAIQGKLINLSHKIPSFEVATSILMNTKLKIVHDALYIESLAVLPAYRGKGVGSKLLEWIIKQTKERFVHEIALHVHVDNKEAIEWYKKKGFQQQEVVKDYYKQQELPNPDAYIFKMTV